MWRFFSDCNQLRIAPVGGHRRRATVVSAKRLLAAFVVAGSLPMPGRAQETPKAEEAVASLRAPAWALLFQIEPRFTLRSFNGLTLALQRSWRSGSAVRFGIVLASSAADLDWSQRQEAPNSLHFATEHRQLNEGSTVLNLRYVGYPRPEGRLRPYWDAGPQASFRRLHQESERSSSTGNSTSTSSVSGNGTFWSAGIGAALGAEWSAAGSFVLLAEYGISAAFGWGTNRFASSPTESVEYDQRYFLVRRSTAIFGLAVRF